MYKAILNAPFGSIGICTQAEQLTRLDFLINESAEKNPSDKFTAEVIKQIKAYFKNPLFNFDLPIDLNVTDFQKSVLNKLLKIKSGKTLTYSDLALSLNSHPRAIGGACRNNPIALIIPCHRVVAKQGLGGFNGKTKGHMLDIKRWLLAFENAI